MRQPNSINRQIGKQKIHLGLRSEDIRDDHLGSNIKTHNFQKEKKSDT